MYITIRYYDIQTYSIILIHSYTHILIYSYAHALIYSYTHILIFSCTHIPIYSYTHTSYSDILLLLKGTSLGRVELILRISCVGSSHGPHLCVIAKKDECVTVQPLSDTKESKESNRKEVNIEPLLRRLHKF